MSKLEARREQVRAATENMLLEARSQGRQTLSESEDRRWRQARADLAVLNEQIAECREDLSRSQIPAHLSRLHRTHRPPQGTP